MRSIYYVPIIALVFLMASTADAQRRTTLMNEDVGICNPRHVSTSQNDTTLSSAIASTSNPDCSGEKTLLLNPGTWSIASNLTIPQRMTLRVPDGAIVDVNGGVTLTVDGPVIADDPEWFKGSGSVVFTHHGWRDPSNQVLDGCNPLVPASSLTIASFSCDAMVREDNSQWPVHEDGGAITVSGSSTTWLALYRLPCSTETPSGWTCVTGTRYVYQASASQPAEPAGGIIFAKVVSTTNIDSIELTANRLLFNTLTLSANLTVNEVAHWHYRPGGMIDCSSNNFVFNGTHSAEPTQQIYTNCAAGEVQYGRISVVYPDWWGVTVDDSTVDNGQEINAAILAPNPTGAAGSSSKGGEVRFNRGEYWTSTTVNGKPAVSMRGTGPFGSAIRCNTTTLGSSDCISFNGASSFTEFGLRIENLSLKGEDTPSGTGAILYINNALDMELYKVNVRSSGAECVHIQGDTTQINVIGGRTEGCQTYNYDVSGTAINFFGADFGATNDFAVGVGTLLRYQGGAAALHGNRFEGSSRAGVCIEWNGASRIHFAGNRIETCVTAPMKVTASTANDNITIENNTIGNSGSAPRIDFQNSGNTCQNIRVLSNRFSVASGTIIFDGSACTNVAYHGNDTDITTPTHVVGYGADVANVYQSGSSTTAQVGIMRDFIVQKKLADESACATSIDAGKGSFWNITSCASTTNLNSITNGYARQVVIIYCTDCQNNWTIVDSGALNTAGNFTPSNNQTIMLSTLDGTNWFELARSTN